MATQQKALTILTPIESDKVEQLREVLKRIVDNDVEHNDIIPFGKLTKIHFARWVIIDQIHQKPVPPKLVFSSNYDAPLEGHLQELVVRAGNGLDLIYSHCKEYPGPEGLLDYLKSHRVGYGAFHVAVHGHSVMQIHQEAELRDAIENYLDQNSSNPNWVGANAPARILADIKEFVGNSPDDLRWALDPPPKPGFFWKLQHYGKLGFLVMPLALPLAFVLYLSFGGLSISWIWYLAPVAAILLAAFLFFVILRAKEKRDPQTPNTRYSEHDAYLASLEDRIVQNQLTNISPVKPGIFRRTTLWLVLKVIEFAARYLFTKGILAGVTTIHFARWVIIDKGSSLIFFSNYGGSWESYLGDFIDKASVGLTAIWSNTALYPKTSFLILQGAKDEQRFKVWGREQQILTDVWYSAYKTLSVSNIINNSEIRNGLSREMGAEEARAWLRRL